MAALDPKPFNILDKIVKRVFKGKPAIYADVDINQAISIDEYAFNSIFDNLGAVSTDFAPTTPTFVQTATQLEFEVDYVGGGKLKYKKTEFDIPAFNFQRLAGSKITISTRANAVCNFWLIAKRNTIDFATDPAMGGVDGTGLASPLPSSDAVTYSDERVDMTIGTDVAPTLSSDEEVIVLLCQIAYKKDWTLSVTGGSTAYLQINCPDEATLEDKSFPTSNYSSKTKGIIATLFKFIDYVENAFTKKGYEDVTDQIIAYTGFTIEEGTKVYKYHTGRVVARIFVSYSGSKPKGSLILYNLPVGKLQNELMQTLHLGYYYGGDPNTDAPTHCALQVYLPLSAAYTGLYSDPFNPMPDNTAGSGVSYFSCFLDYQVSEAQ